MFRQRVIHLLLISMILLTQPGCWSSKEIEDLSVFTGLALDKGEPNSLEREFDERGGSYQKHNKVTATVQIVPERTIGNSGKDGETPKTHFNNISETGDSLLEIFREFSIRQNRPIIGHHLKVIVISEDLVQQEKIRQIMDFVLRDNDIRPSCLIFLSEGRASDTLMTTEEEIPSFRLAEMVRNNFRTSKIMKGITLSNLDALMYSKQSFVLQNVIEAQGEVKFSGAGIIKGDTGHWIGNLDQHDVESIAWIKGDIKGGSIKAYDQSNDSITYEIKSVKSKITLNETEDKKISFHVAIESTGRLIEDWDVKEHSSSVGYFKELEKIFEEKLTQHINSLIHKMQSTYKVEVAGFGDWYSIEKPHVWKQIKDHWDEEFTRIPVTFDLKLKITDFGSTSD
ncbi:Ger(x)C family spore germination protein [Paenibacillus sp. B2(2019)]|uniref:Ger(x)C family spore germination protein n=1 Tax=Paenibacillus sp. B2(2019) TaxID=2607754 RepID=UPI0011F3A767|nr:Ger(x)C family spore germination protein [Paenibacillus sp. B2(2019)]KAA1180987.1 Ger(x)C family spore germination protein [Paenibacillus sp. B2(2019)]